MDEGLIVEGGSVDAVFNKPQTAAARELVHV
jgi:ABC-type microcin C transport system duplicated ATPase subunit YejF